MKILVAAIFALTLAGCAASITPRLNVDIGPSYYQPHHHWHPYWGGWERPYWR